MSEGVSIKGRRASHSGKMFGFVSCTNVKKVGQQCLMTLKLMMTVKLVSTVVDFYCLLCFRNVCFKVQASSSAVDG